MKSLKLIFISLVLIAPPLFHVFAQNYQPNWESLDKRPIPEWFVDAKFGIFIHWGVYSVPAWGAKGSYSEWYWSQIQDTNGEFYKFHVKTYGKDFKYQDFAPMFKAELFNPDQWADLFLKSGAKYVMPTSKHHEGFCLWPNRESWNWNSVDIGPHRDLMGDLTKSVRSRGLKMGFYYSLLEWFNPLYKKEFPRFVDEHFFPQFKDLVNRYEPSIIFTDGEWEKTSAEWKSPQLLTWLFNESPVKNEIVINDRWGSDTRSYHGGYFCTEYGGLANKEMTEDHPWEENRGIGASFGFNRNEDISDYRSPDELVDLLATTVSEGGNLLLDIGPDADGTIPVIMQERLLQIGEWLKINGEAIYATRPYRFLKEGENIRFTKSKDGKYVYMILLRDFDKVVRSKRVAIADGSKITMLGTKDELHWKKENGELIIDIPDHILINKPSSYALVLKMEALPYVSKPKFTTSTLLSDKPIDVEIQKDKAAEIRYTLDGSDPSINSALYTQPLKVKKTTVVKARVFQQGFEPSAPISSEFVIIDSKVNGLNYTYYHGRWDRLPDFKSLKPERTGIAYDVSLKGVNIIADGFGVVYEGFINIEKAGDYTFYLSSDDGSNLYLNDKKLIDHDGLHGMEEKSASISLPAGKVPVKIEFFEAGGGDGLELKFSGPGIEKQKITQSILFRK